MRVRVEPWSEVLAIEIPQSNWMEPRFTISLEAQHPKIAAIHKPLSDYPPLDNRKLPTLAAILAGGGGRRKKSQISYGMVLRASELLHGFRAKAQTTTG